MNIYVASKYEDAMRAANLMRVLEGNGHHITHDWTREEPNTPAELLGGCAFRDVNGVKAADLVVTLFHEHLRGGLVEIGVALGRDTPVWLVGAPINDRCIFFKLCRHLQNPRDVLDALHPKGWIGIIG